MNRALLAVLAYVWIVSIGTAQAFETDVTPLIESSCIRCHGTDTDTPLNLASLDNDLGNPDTFEKWEQVFERVQHGEMPPASESQPDPVLLETALASLKAALLKTDLANRGGDRVPLRRLTRLEYEYTMRDLLYIEEDLAKLLPAESDSGEFNTVAAKQGISPIHIRSYLEATDIALDAAIILGEQPDSQAYKVDYLNSPYVNSWYDKPVTQGGDLIKKLDDAVAMFADFDYVLRTDLSGFSVTYPGFYRITMEAYSYQANTPVTLTLIQTNETEGSTKLIGAYDLVDDKPRTIELTAYLRPHDYLYPSVADLDWPTNSPIFFNNPTLLPVFMTGAKVYKGEGIALKSFVIEGPVLESWPPPSTRQVLTGIRFDNKGGIVLTKSPYEHVVDIVAHIAPLAFRHPLEDGELEAFASLAKPAITEGREFLDVIRVPLRAILNAPQFLYHFSESGELDGFALATRLSYFLWRSMPDEELFQAARDGTLSDPDMLRTQVERMLKDKKAMRFVKDFIGQWLRLNEFNATTPDEQLYPEFDGVLRNSILKETELFFKELIAKDLGVAHLIDSDFSFLNRRLAEHYDIEGIEGQTFREVALPEDSPRGGILTHASVLKVTANGTLTSPVTRGNFVLDRLFGQPPNPPPPSAGSVEPDIRGTTTIREILARHRDEAVCASCHQSIDPPGFALESFDPIGGFRTRYRASVTSLMDTNGDGGVDIDEAPLMAGYTNRNNSKNVPQEKLNGRAIIEYTYGQHVDPSGVTPEGKTFTDIEAYKKLLLEKEDLIARHFISELVVFATGGEIQFADKEEISRVTALSCEKGYPVRTIIHNVVQSDLFRNK